MKLFILLLSVLSISSLNAQDSTIAGEETFLYYSYNPNYKATRVRLNCSETINATCNNLLNPNFITVNGNNGEIVNAFSDNKVTNWYGNPGTADINRWFGQTPPSMFPNLNFANLGAEQGLLPGGPTTFSEGIYTKIKPTTINDNYVLSFFRNVVKPGSITLFKSFSLKIILAKCNEFPSWQGGYGALNYPNNYQIVYCENYTTIDNLKHIVIEFSANNEYDLIWITTESNIEAPFFNERVAFINITSPELIKKNNLTISTSTPDDLCNVSLSFNCSYRNAVYAWYNSQGNPLGNSQQINTNASSNSGIIHGQIQSSTPYSNNNICSNNNPIIQTSTNLTNCTPCPKPTLSPSGRIDVITDCDNFTFFEISTNLTNNCQWYKNGILIPGATNPTLSISTATDNANYSVANTLTGCVSDYVNVNCVYVNQNCNQINYFNSPYSYCRASNSTIRQNPLSNPNTLYSWEFYYPNLISILPSQNNISPITFTTNSNSVFVKAIASSQNYTRYYYYSVGISPYLSNNVANPTYHYLPVCQSMGLNIKYGNSNFELEEYDFGIDAIPQTFTAPGNSTLQNLIINYSTPGNKIITKTYSNSNGTCKKILCNAFINGSCRVVNNEFNNKPQKNSSYILYPNPASNFVIIDFISNTLNSIVIYSNDGKLIKQINLKTSFINKYQLNLDDLTSGVYIIKLLTNKDVNNSKLIVTK